MSQVNIYQTVFSAGIFWSLSAGWGTVTYPSVGRLLPCPIHPNLQHKNVIYTKNYSYLEPRQILQISYMCNSLQTRNLSWICWKICHPMAPCCKFRPDFLSIKWKGSNRKQSARCHDISQLKSSAFCIW